MRDETVTALLAAYKAMQDEANRAENHFPPSKEALDLYELASQLGKIWYECVLRARRNSGHA